MDKMGQNTHIKAMEKSQREMLERIEANTRMTRNLVAFMVGVALTLIALEYGSLDGTGLLAWLPLE